MPAKVFLKKDTYITQAVRKGANVDCNLNSVEIVAIKETSYKNNGNLICCKQWHVFFIITSIVSLHSPQKILEDHLATN